MGALVLIAEADPFDLRFLSDLCASCGYGVVTVADGDSALNAVARDRPDLVVLDAQLSGTGTFEVLRVLKEDASLASIPVLLITEQDDGEARRRGMEAGAEDYLTRPFRVFEVQHRIRSTLKLRAIQSARMASMAPPVDLADHSTGVGTYSQLHLNLEYELTRAARFGHPLSCVSVCIRNLAALDGPQAPSSREAVATSPALVELADGLRSSIRVVDHLFRAGPDEFVLLLPETDQAGAAVVCDRLRAADADQSLFRAPRDPKPDLGIASASHPDPEVQGAHQLLALARRRARDATS